MIREEEDRLRAMFDAAAAELTQGEREDRDSLLGAFQAEGGLTARPEWTAAEPA
jgi:hypothetical protein